VRKPVPKSYEGLLAEPMPKWTALTLPIPPSIADDDPEVLRVLAGIRKPVLKLSEVISAGPHGRTRVYQDLSTGLLATFVSSGRRFVFAV
jgi:hypothetical protein